MSKKNLFIIIGIFWLVIIGGFVAYKEFTLRTGNEVLLKTAPVDPRDLFRGDYVILRYEISTVTADLLSSQAIKFKENDTIYVSLEIGNNNVAEMTAVSRSKPEDGRFIKGVIQDVSSNRLTVEYGIESYFVPEGEGREIEKSMRSGKVYSKVVIDDFGKAVLKSLVIDDQEVVF